ncbi:MAG: biotin/lipoyl-binding protein [Anaerolineae bacterium]|nr:biotin/lipoyl-binding protein [Anaerolineae bacterium]
MKYITTINGKQFEIDIQKDGSILVNGQPRDVDFLELSSQLYSMIMNGRSLEVVIEEKQGHYQVAMADRMYEGTVLDERAQLMLSRRGVPDEGSGELSIRSPMPGLIVSIPVEEGQFVEKGQTVVVLESMKMQNELKTPREGTVQRISVHPGQSVEQKKILITIV